MAPLIALQVLTASGDIATATATMMFMRQLSTAISVVIGGVISQNQMQKHYAMLDRAGVSAVRISSHQWERRFFDNARPRPTDSGEGSCKVCVH